MASLVQRLNWARLAEMRRGVKKRGEFRPDVKVDIPDFVQADRDRRNLLRPRDVSSALCGDPLPGCSMLERGPEPKQPRRTDALDALIYRRA